MKTILFDGRFLSLGHGGIGRYSSELLKALLLLDQKQPYTLLTIENTPIEESLQNLIKKRNVKQVTTTAGHYSFAEQFALLKQINILKPDLIHFPHFNHPIMLKRDFIVTIHDLTLSDYSERGNLFKRYIYKKVIDNGAHKSKKILTVSDYVNKQLTKTFQLPSDKVVTTYNGIDEGFKKITNPRVLSRAERYGLDSPYVLSLGQWRSHKNLVGLVKAFAKLLHSNERSFRNIKLAFAGKEESKFPQLKEAISDLGLEQKVIFTGFISDEDLPVVYNNAELFVFPSFSEGFGLPGLEAQACGVPVASSNKTALPEILGDGAIYFDPANITDMTLKMRTVLSDKRLAERLSKKGQENAKKYSWKQTAEKTLAVYQEILYK